MWKTWLLYHKLLEDDIATRVGFLEDVNEAIGMDSSLEEWIVCVTNNGIRNVESISVVLVERGI